MCEWRRTEFDDIVHTRVKCVLCTVFLKGAVIEDGYKVGAVTKNNLLEHGRAT